MSSAVWNTTRSTQNAKRKQTNPKDRSGLGSRFRHAGSRLRQRHRAKAPGVPGGASRTTMTSRHSAQTAIATPPPSAGWWAASWGADRQQSEFLIETPSLLRGAAPARHETIRVRGLDLHLRRWGPERFAGEPPVFLLHGFQDTGDTFQFLADLPARRALVAIDWRGFGRSDWARDGYWFPGLPRGPRCNGSKGEPRWPVRLVGHSMGGNVATCTPAAPERVSCLVNLEGLGMPRTCPARAGSVSRMAGSGQGGPAAEGLRFLRPSRRHHPLSLSSVQRGAIEIHGRRLG